MSNTTRTITVSSRNGQKSVETPYSDDQAIQRLIDLSAPEGPLARSSFALDLCRSSMSARGLSAKQLAWVHVLVVEAEQRLAQPEPEAVLLPNIAAVLRRSREAGLKTPKVQFPAGDVTPGGKIRFATTGAQSANPGTIHVTDGGAYGENTYYGKLDPETGELRGRALPEAVRALLDTIEQDPAQYAVLSGQQTGECCFCCRELTTKESVGAGYGPICAERQGLPWGAETAALFTPIEAIRTQVLSAAQDEHDRAVGEAEVAAEDRAGINGRVRHARSQGYIATRYGLPPSAGRDEAEGLSYMDLRELGGVPYSF